MGDRRDVKTLKRQSGFTVVELLVVIVVIAILAAITITVYNGLQERAKATALASDLRNAAQQLKMDQALNGQYPADLTSSDENRGVKVSGGTTLYYAVDNSTSPPTFCLTGTNGGLAYKMTDSSTPVEGICAEHVGLVAGGGDNGGNNPPPSLNPALVAAYGFNEASGTTFANQVPGGPAAALWPGAQITSGHTGNAVVGTNGHQAAVVTGNPALNSQGWNGITVSFWVYRSDTDGKDVLTLWENSGRTGNNVGIVYFLDPPGFGVSVHATGTDNWPRGSVVKKVHSGTWCHVAYSWSGTENKMKFYIDGVLHKIVDTTGPASLISNTAVIDIGGTDKNGGAQMAGKIDDLRIYKAAIPDADVVTDMNTPVP